MSEARKVPTVLKWIIVGAGASGLIACSGPDTSTPDLVIADLHFGEGSISFTVANRNDRSVDVVFWDTVPPNNGIKCARTTTVPPGKSRFHYYCSSIAGLADGITINLHNGYTKYNQDIVAVSEAISPKE
jgi:hypothetical protein